MSLGIQGNGIRTTYSNSICSCRDIVGSGEFALWSIACISGKTSSSKLGQGYIWYMLYALLVSNASSFWLYM